MTSVRIRITAPTEYQAVMVADECQAQTDYAALSSYASDDGCEQIINFDDDYYFDWYDQRFFRKIARIYDVTIEVTEFEYTATYTG